ncbi:hypothetical protein MTO96_001443 [Rhipicephalus appendiculatus]
MKAVIERNLPSNSEDQDRSNARHSGSGICVIRVAGDLGFSGRLLGTVARTEKEIWCTSRACASPCAYLAPRHAVVVGSSEQARSVSLLVECARVGSEVVSPVEPRVASASEDAFESFSSVRSQLSIPRFRPTLPSSPVPGEQGGCRSSRTSSGAQGLARERRTLIFGNRRRERKSQRGLGRGGSRRDRPFVSNHFLLSRKRPPSIHLGPRSAGGTSLVGCFVSPSSTPRVFDRPPRRTALPDGRLPSCRATIRDGDVAQPTKTPFRAQSLARFKERRRAFSLPPRRAPIFAFLLEN